MPLKVAFLNVLDHVPADVKVEGNVFDRHVPEQVQGIAFPGVGVAETRVSESEFYLSSDMTVVALDTWDSEEQVNPLGTDWYQAKQSRLAAVGGDIRRVTNGTTKGCSILLDGEQDSALEVVGPGMVVAAHAKRLIK
jgi:hypothetical protein